MAIFNQGDYRYTTLNNTDVKAEVIDKTKTQYATMPQTVTNLGKTYTVTSIISCFDGCTNMTTAPLITSTAITNMSTCFRNCRSLTRMPVIMSRNVTSMYGCFAGCTSLSDVREINWGTNINMSYCFQSCTSLITAPKISVSGSLTLIYCFADCTGLRGDILISGNITTGYNMLNGTSGQTKVLYYSNSNAQDIVNEAGDTYLVLANVGITLLKSERIEPSKVRVDMVLDCSQGKYIIDTSSSVLYNMDGTLLQIGDGVQQPNTIRCYAIYNTNLVNPQANIPIMIKTIAPDYNSALIGFPMTADPSQIKQESRSSVISTRTNAESVGFNQQTMTDLKAYSVKDFLGKFGYQATSNYKNIQFNTDGNVKQCVTHARNVMINETTTLQDWIDARYNEL